MKVDILLLAAGASTRMRGRDKLLEPLNDTDSLLRHTARVAASAAVNMVHVMTLPSRLPELAGLDVIPHVLNDSAGGMSASLRCGISASDADAVIIALADMPDVCAADYAALVTSYDPKVGREICRATTAGGRQGHPVLFGRRFFDELQHIDGDQGAKSVIQNNREFVFSVPTNGQSAIVDLDTPEDWITWRK